jgi:hypothetical protein
MSLLFVYLAGIASGLFRAPSPPSITSSSNGGEAGEVIEIDRDALLGLIQTDAELSEILRAFVFRRIESVARGSSDVVLVGSGLICRGEIVLRNTSKSCTRVRLSLGMRNPGNLCTFIAYRGFESHPSVAPQRLMMWCGAWCF